MILSMLGLGGGKLAILAAVGTAVAVVIGGLYLQNRGLRTNLDSSLQNQAKLETAVELQQSAIVAAREETHEWRAAFSEFQQTVADRERARIEAGREGERLEKIFSDHDLTNLAFERPDTIERLINSGTADALSMFSRATTQDPDRGSDVGSTTAE